MSAANILVVDDEPFNLDIIAEFLDGADYALRMALSAEEAWAVLISPDSDFDLVVLDRMMPGMDGMALLRKIKAEPRLSDLPVVMQTAAASPDQVREGLEAGAFYYLTKPFEPEALQTIIRTALADMRVRRELRGSLSSQAMALRLMRDATFEVRTLDEAQALAALVAQVCRPPDAVALGLSELLVNGVEHGNLGISFDEKTRLRETDTWELEVQRRLELPENRDKRVRLRIRRMVAGWTFEVCDEGAGFDWPRYLDFDPERAFSPNGRGIALSRQIAFSSLDYFAPGNRVLATVNDDGI
ncbi:MAG: response regulator [Zoogloea sp.]|nr:response regulator [Zoogloea sp.]